MTILIPFISGNFVVKLNPGCVLLLPQPQWAAEQLFLEERRPLEANVATKFLEKRSLNFKNKLLTSNLSLSTSKYRNWHTVIVLIEVFSNVRNTFLNWYPIYYDIWLTFLSVTSKTLLNCDEMWYFWRDMKTWVRGLAQSG